MGFFPRTPSFTNLSFVDAFNLLTGHCNLLDTPRVFVGMRGLTFMRNILLPSTLCSDDLSLTVCNFMRCLPIYLLPLAYGAQRSPLIYPANRIRSVRQLRRIRCYKMCSTDSGLWCRDVTTQVVMTRRLYAGARGGCYFYSSKFMRVKIV